MSYLGDLTSIGDELILNINKVEQVSSINSFSDNVTGETATRTVTKEFRWSTDGTYSGSWIALTNAQLTALSLTANNPFYIQVKYTRGGSDATGTIGIDYIVFSYTFDPQATQGHGQLVNTLLDEEVPTLMQEMIENYIYQYLGGDHYSVQHVNPLFCTPTNKPIVYVYDFDTADVEYISLCNWLAVIRFRVGIKKMGDNRTKGYGWQLGRLRTMFNERLYNQFTYDLTFKSTDFVGVTMEDFGIIESRASGMQEFADEDCQQLFHEFAVELKLRFEQPHYDSV